MDRFTIILPYQRDWWNLKPSIDSPTGSHMMSSANTVIVVIRAVCAAFGRRRRRALCTQKALERQPFGKMVNRLVFH